MYWWLRHAKIDSVKTGISVVINTRNEERFLPGALRSVKNIAQEIILVDMESSDGTIGVAESFGAKVFTHKPVSYVEPVRNFSIQKATGPWILILDPDEEIPPALARELLRLSKLQAAKDPSFYRLPRQNIIFNKWITGARWWPDFNIRFFKKGSVTWTEIIHGVPLTTGIGRDLAPDKDHAIIHHHYDSIEKFILWSNRYADARAGSLEKSDYQFSWPDLIRKPVGEFLSRFFFGEGYKDGVHGLAICLLQGYAELMVLLKVWEKLKFPEKKLALSDIGREINKSQKEIKYWLAESALKEERNPLKILKHRVARKLSS